MAKQKMSVVTIKLLLSVETDGEAADFCAETFREMPYVMDWGHVDEMKSLEIDLLDYNEGDFLTKEVK